MRLTMSIFASIIVLIVFWLGGYDFNERGFLAAYSAIFTIIAFFIVYSCPGWKK